MLNSQPVVLGKATDKLWGVRPPSREPERVPTIRPAVWPSGTPTPPPNPVRVAPPAHPVHATAPDFGLPIGHHLNCHHKDPPRPQQPLDAAEKQFNVRP